MALKQITSTGSPYTLTVNDFSQLLNIPYIILAASGGGTIEVNLPSINSINKFGQLYVICEDGSTTVNINTNIEDVISEGSVISNTKTINGDKAFLQLNATTYGAGNLWLGSTNGGSGVVVPITYNDLINLASANNLTQTKYYLITDFQTVTYIQFSGGGIGSEDINVGAIEPMLVQAATSNSFSTNIISTLVPTDEITWKPIFNDRDYDAVLGQSTGVITSRYDTLLKLYRDYDWRNVIFRRWETVSGSGDYNNYTDTGFAFQDFPPFNLALDTFDASVGSGLEAGQIVLGLPYQLDNVVFQLDCALSKVSFGAVSTFQEIFTVNNIDVLVDQLCRYEFTQNNIKFVQSNQFDGQVNYNTLVELSSNDISDDFLGNIGVSFVENQINGTFEDNNFSFLYQNTVTGDIFQNLFMTAIQGKTFTSTAGMQAFSPSVTLLDAVDGDVEQILSGGVLSYVQF